RSRIGPAPPDLLGLGHPGPGVAELRARSERRAGAAGEREPVERPGPRDGIALAGPPAAGSGWRARRGRAGAAGGASGAGPPGPPRRPARTPMGARTRTARSAAARCAGGGGRRRRPAPQGSRPYTVSRLTVATKTFPFATSGTLNLAAGSPSVSRAPASSELYSSTARSAGSYARRTPAAVPLRWSAQRIPPTAPLAEIASVPPG